MPKSPRPVLGAEPRRSEAGVPEPKRRLTAAPPARLGLANSTNPPRAGRASRARPAPRPRGPKIQIQPIKTAVRKDMPSSMEVTHHSRGPRVRAVPQRSAPAKARLMKRCPAKNMPRPATMPERSGSANISDTPLGSPPLRHCAEGPHCGRAPWDPTRSGTPTRSRARPARPGRPSRVVCA